MVNTRSSPKWADIVTITGRAQWFESPHHNRFKRKPVAMEQGYREGTQTEPQIEMTLTFSTPPNSVSTCAVIFAPFHSALMCTPVVVASACLILTFHVQGNNVVQSWS